MSHEYQVGDKVAVWYRRLSVSGKWMDMPYEAYVARVTKTQVTLDDKKRYNIKTGRRIGWTGGPFDFCPRFELWNERHEEIKQEEKKLSEALKVKESIKQCFREVLEKCGTLESLNRLKSMIDRFEP